MKKIPDGDKCDKGRQEQRWDMRGGSFADK